MLYRTSAAVAISVAAAGLCLAGCQGSTTGASGTSSGQASQAPPATATPPAATPASSTAPGAGQGPGQAGSGGRGVSAGAPCQTSQLRVALGKNTPSTGNSMLNVDLINTGPVSCTMDGFPGVNLVGTASGKSNYQWPLERGAQVKPSTVTLAASGGTAHFTIAYLAYASGEGQEINVNQILITPPGQYSHTSTDWNQGVLLQDAATRPGTWIEPVQPGA